MYISFGGFNLSFFFFFFFFLYRVLADVSGPINKHVISKNTFLQAPNNVLNATVD